jgi:hypothetical protein
VTLNLLKRLEKGPANNPAFALTATEHDANFTAIENAVNTITPSYIIEQALTIGTGPAVFADTTDGVVSPSWELFAEQQTVHLRRGDGDVTAGPLLVRLPVTNLAGQKAVTLQREAFTATAATQGFVVEGCSYVNTEGVAVITTPTGTVAALNIEEGDAFTGDDFIGAAVASIDGDIITATVSAAQETTATLTFQVPHSTVGGGRRATMPHNAGGAYFFWEQMRLPSGTVLGEITIGRGGGGGDASNITFNPGDSGAIGPDVETGMRDLGARVTVIEGGDPPSEPDLSVEGGWIVPTPTAGVAQLTETAYALRATTGTTIGTAGVELLNAASPSTDTIWRLPAAPPLASSIKFFRSATHTGSAWIEGPQQEIEREATRTNGSNVVVLDSVAYLQPGDPITLAGFAGTTFIGAIDVGDSEITVVDGVGDPVNSSAAGVATATISARWAIIDDTQRLTVERPIAPYPYRPVTLICKQEASSSVPSVWVSDDAGQTGTLAFAFGGVGEALEAGDSIYAQIDYPFEIIGWTILAAPSGSVAFRVRAGTYADWPLDSGDNIVASAPPSITTATKGTSTTLTGWTTAFPAGTTIEVAIDSATTVTAASLMLAIRA